MLELPVTSDPYTTQSYVVDGVNLVLDISWNDISDGFYANIKASDGTVIASSIKLDPYTDVTGRYKSDLLPVGGAIYCIPTSPSISETTIDNLGSDVKLYYLTREELAFVLY